MRVQGEINAMSDSTPRTYTELVERLAAVRRKANIAAIAWGSTLTGLALLGLTFIALIVEDLLYLDTVARTIIFYVLLLFACGLLLWLVVRPLLKLVKILPNESDTRTAAKVGRKFPQINDHLVNILQLFHERTNPRLYSPALIDASFEDVRKEIERVNFTSIVDYSASRRMGKLFAVAVGVGVLLFIILPGTFVGSAYRLFHHSLSFAQPLPFNFIVEPGNKEVVKGETVQVTVRVQGEPQKSVTLISRPVDQIAGEERTLDATPGGVFKHEFASLKSSTSYFVRSGPVQSYEFMLSVIDRPVVRILRLQLDFPTYAGLATRQLDDNVGDVLALKGTRVHFSIESSKPLETGRLVFSDSTEVALEVNANRARGTLTLVKDRAYHVVLKDEEGLVNAEPIEYSMKVVPDAFPTASILIPGANIDIAENAQLNMLFKIADDYGFISLRLAHRLMQSRYERPAEEFSHVHIPIPPGVRTEADIAYLWSLKNLSLVPEDVVSYYIEVFDNDNVSGPKSARSEVYTLRLPSLDEVFANVERSHEVSIEGMKEAMKDVEQARKELEELQQDMKKNQQKMDWQQQKKAEEMLKKYQEIQKKLDEVQKTVDQMVNEMQKNQVISEETLEKYQELQQLMEQLNSPEFAEAMKKMQEAMRQLSPEAMRQAMQQFQFSEENFRKSLERTLNLLKRIQIEQKIDESLKRTEEMMKQQEELQKQTEQTNPGDKDKLNDLARQQKDLKDKLDQLQKELADLQEKMKEFPAEMPLSEMEEARQELDQSQLDQQMEEIAQQLQGQQMQQAIQGQKQAMQKMGQFMQKMQQMQHAMKENQQRQIVNEMRKAMQDLLELSKRQEALKNESRALEQNSQRFRDNSQEQMEVMRDLANVTNSLSKLSQKTFGITPEMGKSIGDAMRQMNQAMQSLEQRNGNAAGQQQSGAMSSLNQAAQQLQGAMGAMMQAGGQGMGMAGFMQRLQQMTGMQQGINQGTQNLGGMTPQQAAELGRLAAEQGMVRKSLEQLAREAANTGELSKMLGDLNRIAQDMREVQTDLAQGDVNPETLRKQERILSRLLDSQRSARERDFEKQRKAQSGTDVARRSPADVDLSTQEGRNRLRQDLMKAMEEGYSRDYQELIRKYFEALERLENQN